MAKADIEITLQGGTDGFVAPEYAPGDSVSGAVSVFPDSNMKCQHLYIKLAWHTEGRGTRYRETIEELDVFQGELQAGMPRSFEFDFRVPAEPWSFAGRYVSVVWQIEAQVDVSWAKDPKAAAPFVLRPSATPSSAESW